MLSLQPAIVDGVTATVGYDLRDVHGEVALRLDGDRWGVTAATSDAATLDLAYAVDGNVIAELTLGPAARSGMRLHLTGITDDGAPADDVVSRFEFVDGGEVTVEAPLTDGATPPGQETDQVVLQPADPSRGAQPIDAWPSSSTPSMPTGSAAVRLDTLVDDDGDPATPDVVIGHATRAVTGRPTALRCGSPDGDAAPLVGGNGWRPGGSGGNRLRGPHDTASRSQERQSLPRLHAQRRPTVNLNLRSR